jgi:hypothetical protein
MIFNMVSALAFQVDRSRTIRPRMADRPGLSFSDCTDGFQTGIIVDTCFTPGFRRQTECEPCTCQDQLFTYTAVT